MTTRPAHRGPRRPQGFRLRSGTGLLAAAAAAVALSASLTVAGLAATSSRQGPNDGAAPQSTTRTPSSHAATTAPKTSAQPSAAEVDALPSTSTAAPTPSTSSVKPSATKAPATTTPATTRKAAPAPRATAAPKASAAPAGTFNPLTYNWTTQTGPRTKTFTTLTENPYFITRSGEILANRRTLKSSGVQVVVDRARDAGLRDCQLGNGFRVYDTNSTTARGVVEHCSVYSSTNGLFGLALIARYNYITSANDGITPTGGAHGPQTIIEYNKIVRDGTRNGERHNDGIQFWQGGNAVIRNNWISGWQTSAIMIKSDLEQVPGDGPIKNILIEGNYLANPTGYYSIYVRDGGFGRPQYITIINNVFGPGTPISSGSTSSDQAVFVRTTAERAAAVRNGVPGAAAWIVWSGNISASTGKEVAPPNGWYTYPVG